MSGRLLGGVLGLGVLALIAGPARGQGNGDPKQYGWRLDYESARMEARRSGKPMFLVFRCVP